MTKIDIISGFLGAGKTTLIKKLISEVYTGEKLVLIENEFGEIGIDGGFLADAGINITEMNSGCICCSLVGDFGKALIKVLDEYQPDRILIEPSGVGKLSDVIRAVQNIDRPDAALNSFTTVCDAGKCRMYIKNFGEFYIDQVEHASAIVMSHTVGMSEEKITKAYNMLRELNSDAVIVTTPWDQLDGRQIKEAIEGNDTLKNELQELIREHNHGHEHCHEDDDDCCGHHHHDGDEECEHHHHHDDKDEECGHHHHDDGECECGHHHHHDHEECDHKHDDEHEHHGHHEHHYDENGVCSCGHHHHHADEVFTSWGQETTLRYTDDKIKKILEDIEQESEYGMVLRAKGIVMAEDGGWIHFDYVPGEPDVRRGSASVTGRICVIGSGISPEKLEKLFSI